MTTLAEYGSSRELFNNLTLRELRSKYKRSVLGWAWSLLNPLATMLIFTLIFRYFLKIQAPPGQPSGLKIFALYLLCGLLPWNYLQNGVNGAIGSLVGNANLIKKTYFPRELLIAANTGSCLVSHLIEVGILLIALVVFGNYKMFLYLPVVIVLIVILTIFTTGLSLLLSVCNVYFRDVQHLMGIVFMIWFYLTPIVYPETIGGLHTHTFHVLGRSLKPLSILRINPMTGFVEAFRNCLYDVRFPAWGTLAYITVVAIVTFVIGLAVFNRLEGRLAEEL